MFADYHVHTSFSMDSNYVMEDVVKDAIKLGIQEICFTDHVDLGNIAHGPYVVDFPNYYKECERLRTKYKDKIVIKIGLEFGVQTHTVNDYNKLFASYPFDFIIMSNHQIDDLEFWFNEYQDGKTQLEINIGYYKYVLETIKKYKNYSVLGHLDVIKRYDPYGILDDKIVEKEIKALLSQVIEDGKGIEINTSSFRYQLPDLTPSRQILKWYKELGGDIITFGSDSHEPSYLGYKITEIKEELKAMGFNNFYTYTKMLPDKHSL